MTEEELQEIFRNPPVGCAYPSKETIDNNDISKYTMNDKKSIEEQGEINDMIYLILRNEYNIESYKFRKEITTGLSIDISLFNGVELKTKNIPDEMKYIAIRANFMVREKKLKQEHDNI